VKFGAHLRGFSGLEINATGDGKIAPPTHAGVGGQFSFLEKFFPACAHSNFDEI
jgi:hypothetical protein